MTLFLEEVEEVVQRLGAPTTLEQTARDLHFMKGSALNLGFAEVASYCQMQECRIARQEEADTSAIAALFQASRTAFLHRLGQETGQAVSG